MTEHIALLEKEIRQLETNLERAMNRPGVTQEEIQNIYNKIRLKRGLLVALSGEKFYAVFVKFHSTDYEPSPKWKRYSQWLLDESGLKEQLETARRNPRFAAAKVVCEVKMRFDVEELE